MTFLGDIYNLQKVKTRPSLRSKFFDPLFSSEEPSSKLAAFRPLKPKLPPRLHFVIDETQQKDFRWCRTQD